MYYYRLCQLQLADYWALQEALPAQLADVLLAPKDPERLANLRLTTQSGTLEIMDADRQMLELVLQGCYLLNNATGFERIYHYDSTPDAASMMETCLVTYADLERFNQSAPGYYDWDREAYPATPND